MADLKTNQICALSGSAQNEAAPRCAAHRIIPAIDYFVKEYVDSNIPHGDWKNYRKVSYFLGVMLNDNGVLFVDEGTDFRKFTYAQFGKTILRQPRQRAWQLLDSKVCDLLHEEYRFYDARYEEADSITQLLQKFTGLDAVAAEATLKEFNTNTDEAIVCDPTIKDGKSSVSIWLFKFQLGASPRYSAISRLPRNRQDHLHLWGPKSH